MSDRDKSLARPKVRFSKSAESPEKFSQDRAFGKPKIRSVTDIRKRVRILGGPNDEFKESPRFDEIGAGRSAGDAPNDSRLCPRKSSLPSTPCLTEIILTPEGRASNVRVPSDTRETGKTVSSNLGPGKTSEDRLVNKKSSTSRSESSLSLKTWKKTLRSVADEVSKPEDKESNVSGSSRTKTSDSGKENVPARESRVALKVPENTPRTRSGTKSTDLRSGRGKIVVKSSKPGVSRRPVESTAIRSSKEVGKITKPSLEPGSRKKIESAIPATTESRKIIGQKPIGLMACVKSGKSQTRIAQTRKTILRDALAGPSRVDVGPGLPRSRSPQPKIRFENEEASGRLREKIHSSDKFARPEYNSIVGTMRRLRDARDERVVEDLEHLPAIYRRLVNGRVSSALDFGANEAIYRDLVDLSIDEKQLPSRLTRSKDPEPRQRDIAPKLSDFFVPTNDEEYRRAVLVGTPSPRVLDTWNPYKISDRIFSWKESLDRDL